MSNYECPNCHGGFPEPLENECPWCGQNLDGSYEYEPRVEGVVTSDSDYDDRGADFLGIFGGNNE